MASFTIPDTFIQDVLSKVDIVDLIRLRLPLKKAGANYLTKCPFHQEKTPSFSVNQAKQFYHCFGCNTSGDAIEFLKQYEGITFVDAVETLASLAGLEVPRVEFRNYEKPSGSADSDNYNIKNNGSEISAIYACLNAANEFYSKQLNKNNKLALEAINYLKKRGITGETAKDFCLGFIPNGWGNLITAMKQKFSESDLVNAGLVIKSDNGSYYDRFRDRIIFPIRDRRGRVIGFGGRVISGGEPKYLNSPETLVFNKSKELYGLYESRQELRNYSNIVVVEGYLDVISLWQAGIRNAVATLGTALTEQHIKLLLSVKEEIVFCFDGDKAGQKAAWRALELCLPYVDGSTQIKFIILPEEDDPDNFIKKYGEAEFIKKIKRSMSLYDFIFFKLGLDLDLTHIDGKASLIARIKPLISIIKPNFIKQILFDRLSQITGVDKDILQTDLLNLDLNKTDHRSGYYKEGFFAKKIKSVSKSSRLKPQASPAIRAAALLLNDRSLIEFADCVEGLSELNIPGVKFFVELVGVLQKNKELPVKEILDLLPDNCIKHFNSKELESIASIIPKDGVKAEFIYNLDFLKKAKLEDNLNKLLGIAKESNLTEKQKLVLKEMLIATKGTSN